MNLERHLLELDRRLWSGGADEYREILDDDCLVAFTKMAGVSDREAVAGAAEGNQRWRDVKLDSQGMLRPTDDVAILTYRATAKRGDEPYRALVSSGYVERDGEWKLMFHQQTPLPDSLQ
jgi:hypothetical protein